MPVCYRQPLLPSKLLKTVRGATGDMTLLDPCHAVIPHSRGLDTRLHAWASRFVACLGVLCCSYVTRLLLITECCLQTLLALFSIDDITGFQITNLVELPEPYGIIFLWGAVFPSIFIFVASITNFVFRDNLILKVCNTNLD